MKKIVFIILISSFIATFLHAQSKAETSILKNLQAQEKAWNIGDIDAFMEYYWNNDSLLFLGKTGPTYGWKGTIDNYKKSYPDRATMGMLSFQILNVQKLSSSTYNVIGKWGLKRDKGDVGGYFTLLWQRIKGKWVIVQDHTS